MKQGIYLFLLLSSLASCETSYRDSFNKFKNDYNLTVSHILASNVSDSLHSSITSSISIHKNAECVKSSTSFQNLFYSTPLSFVVINSDSVVEFHAEHAVTLMGSPREILFYSPIQKNHDTAIQDSTIMSHYDPRLKLVRINDFWFYGTMIDGLIQN